MTMKYVQKAIGNSEDIYIETDVSKYKVDIGAGFYSNRAKNEAKFKLNF